MEICFDSVSLCPYVRCSCRSSIHGTKPTSELSAPAISYKRTHSSAIPTQATGIYIAIIGCGVS